MDTHCGAAIASFLTLQELHTLRIVCRRWHFTCACLQFTPDVQPRKSVWNLESRRFRHVWHTYIHEAGDAFLPHLLRRLPDVIKPDTEELKKGLCLSTNTGVRPSFDNAHARSGYIEAKINRCGNLPNLLMTEELTELRSELFRAGKKQWTIALYGGGPGFDTVGLAFLRRFLRAQDIAFHTNVYDNEPGWEIAVTAVKQTLDQLQYEDTTWSFKHCDITFDVHDAVNLEVQADLEATQLLVFSFVCVENYQLLQQSEFAFLRSLFQEARDGSYFIFTDSTHRLWPVISEVAVSVCPDKFRVLAPFGRGCHYALVLQKLVVPKPASEFPFYAQTMERFALFRRHHRDQCGQ
ncbi:hypothetical protein FI667_g3801, partial [Globisporangium splendens]